MKKDSEVSWIILQFCFREIIHISNKFSELLQRSSGESSPVKTEKKSSPAPAAQEPAPASPLMLTRGPRVHSVLGVYDTEDNADDIKDMKFVVMLKDATKSIRSREELCEKYPLKLIKFYETQIKWSESTFQIDK